jgi:hypothetical protein
MLTERSYDLELLAVNLPTEIRVNGILYTESSNRVAGTWKYDNTQKLVKIYLPKVSCNQKTEITVKFNDRKLLLKQPENQSDDKALFNLTLQQIKKCRDKFF